MPMKRENYPSNWEEISLAVREEAGWRCEFCGAENGKPNPITGSKVVLTVAHLNHDTHDNRRENLRALCQRCHLNWDKEYHRAHRLEREKRNAIKS